MGTQTDLKVLPSPHGTVITGAEVVMRNVQKDTLHENLLHDLEVVTLGCTQQDLSEQLVHVL